MTDDILQSMIEKISAWLDMVYRRVIRIVSHDYFFYGVISLCVAQGIWFAFSFVPWVNDEQRHIGNILIYSLHLSPFLGDQQPGWDYLGQISRDGSFMFYYLMSWPLRFVRLFTTDNMAQVISLRLVCIAMFATGLVVFRRALLLIGGVPRSVINVLFLFFISIPAVAILPATVNYDDMVFPFFAALLFFAVKCMKSTRPNMPAILSLISLSLLLSVVKWTSIALVVPVLLYLSYDHIRKYRKSLLEELIHALKRLNRWQVAMWVIVILILGGLFIERPVMNVLLYHSPEPKCQQVIGSTRCEKFHDYVAYSALLVQKPRDFKPVNVVRYLALIWMPRMIDTAENVLERGPNSEIARMVSLYSMMTVFSIVVLLLYARDILHDRKSWFLLVVGTLYTSSLIVSEYQNYQTYAVPASIRARYLAIVLPIFLYFVAIACMRLFRNYKKVLVIFAVILLILSIQGGGILTYLLTSPPNAFWKDSPTNATNEAVRSSLGFPKRS